MTRLKSTLCGALALSFAAGAAAPVVAAPVFVPKAPEAANSVIDVQFRRNERRNRFERRGNDVFLNGRRGYRERRAGYREYNGFWFPAGAFIAGLVIGGALDRMPTASVPAGSAHVRWCHNRWRSYDAYSNSYQPLNGPRRICVSPYS